MNKERLDKMKDELQLTIDDLDLKLNRVVNKQEYDYLQGYQLFVQKKTNELRAIIDKLNEKNSNTSIKDERIVELELIINKLRNEAQRCDEQMGDKIEEMKTLKTKVDLIQEDRRFLYVSARDEKQKGMTMQKRLDQLEKDLQETQQKLEESEKQCNELRLMNLRQETYENEQLTGDITMRRNKSLTIDRSQKNISIVQGGNNYFCPLTQNKKFEEFLKDLNDIKIDQDRVKQEIINYVKVIESFYTQKLQNLRQKFDKKIRASKISQSNKVSMHIERNELEKIFSNSIDEVKKQILKRKVKSETILNNKSKPMSLDKTLNDSEDEDAKRFEEAITKLLSFAKNKIKYEDFTSVDKKNLITLFVTNERTLLYVYRSLFQLEEKIKQNPLNEKQIQDLKLSPRSNGDEYNSKNGDYKYFITETQIDEDKQLKKIQQEYSSINEDEQYLRRNFRSLDQSVEVEQNQTIRDQRESQQTTLSNIQVGVHLPRINIKKVKDSSQNNLEDYVTIAQRSKSTIKTNHDSKLNGISSHTTMNPSSRIQPNYSNLENTLKYKIGSIQQLRNDGKNNKLELSRNSMMDKNLTSRKKSSMIKQQLFNPNNNISTYDSANLSLFNLSNIEGRNSSYMIGNMSNLIEGFGSRKKQSKQAKQGNTNRAMNLQSIL
ncbi:UNKNOWN [Stylonychia lemnae]|uniref:Uncharacterized protein n=1 Tax=Stylonychia lemnae TaxID=5949 RepID=A0A078B3Q9_STYLE|nr:UNKNOWN [Stylonychia lemnae]|eukprot:CDW88143.1 UNKNOWN [Stylonychia lemnae]